MFSSWCSAWTTENPLMRSSDSRSRSLRSNPAWRTRPRNQLTSPWWSVATKMTTAKSSARYALMKVRILSPVMKTVLTSKCQPRRTPMWMRCFMSSSAWPSYLMRWALPSTGKSPSSMVTLSNRNPSGCADSRTWTPMAWSLPLLADQVSTVTWSTSNRKFSGKVSPGRERNAQSSEGGLHFCLKTTSTCSALKKKWSVEAKDRLMGFIEKTQHGERIASCGFCRVTIVNNIILEDDWEKSYTWDMSAFFCLCNVVPLHSPFCLKNTVLRRKDISTLSLQRK